MEQNDKTHNKSRRKNSYKKLPTEDWSCNKTGQLFYYILLQNGGN